MWFSAAGAHLLQVYFDWNEWLFELLLPSYQLKAALIWPLVSATHFWTVFHKLKFVLKSPRTSAVSQTRLWANMSHSVLNHLSCPFWCTVWTSVSRPDHVYIPKCIKPWLHISLKEQLSKCPVSAWTVTVVEAHLKHGQSFSETLCALIVLFFCSWLCMTSLRSDILYGHVRHTALEAPPTCPSKLRA